MTETTEQVIDEAMQNLEEGKVGDPINLHQTESVESKATRDLVTALPIFRAKLRSLLERNRTEVARVLESLMEYPLEQETRVFTTDQANELFGIGAHITNCKIILFGSALVSPDLVKELDEKMVEQVKQEGEQV